MTRTALASPDDPDDPNREAAFTHYYSMAMAAAFAEHQRSSGPLDKIIFKDDAFKGIDLIHTDGSGQVLFFQAKQCSLPAKRPWHARISPQRLAGLAVFIAGRKRADLSFEWRAHLSGETGSGLSLDRQVHEAAGFICAAIRYRVQDAADFAWRPVDAVLGSRKLSNLFVFLATLMIAMFYVHHGGLDQLADNLEGAGVTWGAAFGLVHVGRQWRDVKPPEHRPRRTKE